METSSTEQSLSYDAYNTNHQAVKAFLEECGQGQYLETFVSEGFETVAAICEATEDDMIAMNVKRGHRRLIQRQVSIKRGSLPQYISSTAMSETSTSFYNSSTTIDNTSTSSSNSRKRKYRRHPKRDKNAPAKPASAYIMFSNDMRSQIKDKNFSEMAKTIGEQWKNLDRTSKQAYELKAMQAKDAYQIVMQQYRKTEEYKQHQRYLKEFKKKEKDKKTQYNPPVSPSSGSMADSSSNNGTESQQVFLVQLPRRSSNDSESPRHHQRAQSILTGMSSEALAQQPAETVTESVHRMYSDSVEERWQ